MSSRSPPVSLAVVTSERSVKAGRKTTPKRRATRGCGCSEREVAEPTWSDVVRKDRFTVKLRSRRRETSCQAS